MATSSDTTVFTATVTSGAPVGTYNVTIDHLASAQQLLSGQFTGDGTHHRRHGNPAASAWAARVSMSPSRSEDDTLNGIAAAINSASGNPGITATVLQGTDGAHLVLTRRRRGAANTIEVTETDGGNALAALTYDSGNTAQLHRASAGQGRGVQHLGRARHQPEQHDH